MNAPEPLTPEQQQQQAEAEAAFWNHWTVEQYSSLNEHAQRAVLIGFCQGWIAAKADTSSAT